MSMVDEMHARMMRVQLFLKGTFVNLFQCQIPVGFDLTVTSPDSDLLTLLCSKIKLNFL